MSGSARGGEYKRIAWAGTKAAVLVLLFLLCVQLKSIHVRADAPACSSGAAAQNGITVAPSHGQAFYIDTGITPKLDAGYVGYRVTNSTESTQANLWTEVSNFTGGVLGLANSLDRYQQVSSLTNSSTAASYFLMKASAATTTPQTHHVRVWSGRPDLPSSSMLYDCIYTFSAVKETIKAAANKVSDTGYGTTAAIEASKTNPEIGQTVTISVEGTTGTIGAGAAPDGSIVWLTPAAVSSWPTRALRLENVSVTFERNTNNGQKWTASGDQVTYTNQLLISNAQNCLKKNANVSTCSGGTGTASPEYRALYTFRVVGIPASTIKAVPVAQIASGTQIKHADTTATGATVDLTFSGVSINASLTKSVTSTTGLQSVTCSSSCSVPGGVNGQTYVAVPYRLTGSSTTTTTVTIDEIVDRPQSGVIFKPGSARITDIGRTNITVSDPAYITSEASLVPRPLHFTGPFSLNSTTTANLSYEMWVPVGSYTNTAYAKIGDLLIGASASSMSKIVITSDGSGTVGVVSTTEELGVVAQTDPATGITTSAATINGTVDPNGANPLTATFTYGTNANLTGATTVTATTPTSGNMSGLSDPTAVSYLLSGLAANTTYYYRVIAGAAQGTILSFTTDAILAPPNVTTAAASNVSATGATFNGTINPNLTSVLAIQFLYGTSSTLATSTAVTLDDGTGANLTASGASAQPFATTVTGLTTGTTYYYKLRACTTSNCSSFVDGGIVSFVAQNPPSNPVLSVTKTEDDADNAVTPGQAVTYTIAITNSGGVNATTAFTDSIPTGMGQPTDFTYTSCGTPSTNFVTPTLSVSSIAIVASATCTITYSVVVSAPLNEGTTLTNSVDVVTANEGGNNPAPVSASTLTVDATPNLSTSTKSVSDINGGVVEPGDTLAYTLTLINTGDGRATGITISDTIDTDTQSITNITYTNCGSPTSSGTSSQLSISAITVAVGTNCVVGFRVTVKSPLAEGTQIANAATISAATEGGVGASPSSTTLLVDATPQLGVAHTENDADDVVAPNQAVTYTISITNSGNGSASGVGVTSAVSTNVLLDTASFNFSNCGSPANSSTIANLAVSSLTIAAGATCTITYTTTVNSSAIDGATVLSSVDVSAATEGGNDPAPTSASMVTVSITPPNLSVTKTENDADNIVAPGQSVTYTITISNTGGKSASTSFTDTIPTGFTAPASFTYTNCGSPAISFGAPTLTVSGITVAASTSCVVTYVVTVASPLNEGTQLTNAVDVVTANEGGNNPAPVSASTLTVDATPNLSTSTKSVSDINGGVVEPGDTLRYTLTLKNTGDGRATGVSISDTIDNDTQGLTNVGTTSCGSPTNTSSSTQLTISGVTVNAGATFCVITFDVTVKSPRDEGTPITNTATVSAATEGGLGASPSSTTLYVDISPTITISSAHDDSDYIVSPNQVVTYTLTLTNSSPGAATVSASDAITGSTGSVSSVSLSSQCGASYSNVSSGKLLAISGISIPAGASCVVQYQVAVQSNATHGATISNNADASAPAEGGIDPAAVQAVALTVRSLPNLTVTKTHNVAGGTVTPGQQVIYTIHIANSGTATGTTMITDSLSSGFVAPTNITYTNCGSSALSGFSSGTLTISQLSVAPSVTCAVSYTVAVRSPLNEGTALTNIVDVAQASEGGNDPGIVTAGVLTVDATPNLSTSSKDVSDVNGGAIQRGDTLRYTLTLKNTGNGTATGVSVDDTISTNTEDLRNITSQRCGSPTNTSTSTALHLSNAVIAVGQDCDITFDVTVAAAAPHSGEIANTATISAASEGGSGASPASVMQYVDAEVTDNDGVTSAAESAGPNGGDSNDDGIPDKDQSSVTTLPNPVTKTYVVLETSGCNGNSNVAVQSASEVANPDGTYVYPAGLMNFSITCAAPGATALVTQYYFGEFDPVKFVARKYNTRTHQYSTLSGATLTSVSIGGQQALKIVYPITDGSELDEDGLANGVIVDPVGPALIVAAQPSVAGMPNTGRQLLDKMRPGLALIMGGCLFTVLLASVLHARNEKQE